MNPHDPSELASDGTCFFSRVPPELRNPIYELMLTEPKGLVYRATGECRGKLCIYDGPSPLGGLSTNIDDSFSITRAIRPENNQFFDSKIPDANQLRFMSRKYYNETRGLGMRLRKRRAGHYWGIDSFPSWPSWRAVALVFGY